MKRRVIETEDGSSTILVETWGESFHSIHGAIQEAQLVYIENGLRFVFQKNIDQIHILEIGFGTGLNCFMTLIESEKNQKKIFYTGVEGFPLQEDEWNSLNYQRFFDSSYESKFSLLHQKDWEIENEISSNFTLIKNKLMFENIEFENQFDLVYFDAFGFQFQPELWSEEIFAKVKKTMKPNGVLVTYACKGVVNRTLKKLGFKIEKLEGPPGKRHMTRAILI